MIAAKSEFRTLSSTHRYGSPALLKSTMTESMTWPWRSGGTSVSADILAEGSSTATGMRI